MQNLLLKYLNERMEPRVRKALEPGPVITISREYGCPGSSVAQILSEKINKFYRAEGKSAEWKWVNKEILRMASNELRLQPEKIRTLMDAGHRGFIEEFVSSFTETYYGQSDMIKKTIGDLIRKLAVDGNIVIVGRGSGAIARDIPKSLHINLVAPLSWKALMISKKRNVTINEAKKLVLEVDKQRANFVEYFRGKSCDDLCYDLTFNCAGFSVDEMTAIILDIALKRGLL